MLHYYIPMAKIVIRTRFNYMLVSLMRLWLFHKKPQVGYSFLSNYVLQYGTHIDMVHVAGYFEHTDCKRTVHQVPETVDCCAGCLQQGHDVG